MNITVIGAGNVASALGKQWLGAGHQVVFAVKDPTNMQPHALLAGLPNLQFLSVKDGAAWGEVLVLTTPAEAVFDVIEAAGSLEGKTVIDATNAIRNLPTPFATAFHALKAKTKAAVVKAFNTTGFENMANPLYENSSLNLPLRLDMFMAGSDETAKNIAELLSRDAGFEHCYNFGGDDKVQLLEQFALSWINLAIMQGHGRNIGFKLVRRGV